MSTSRRLSPRVWTLAVALGIALFASACSMTMKHDALAPAPKQFTDEVRTSRRAEGIDGKVGWSRFTLAAIPLVPVHLDGDGNEQMMDQVRDALKQVGYRPVIADDAAPGRSPLFKCKIEKFWFNNYTWPVIFPFVPTWGDVEVTATLVSPSGLPLWSKSFKGSGFTVNPLSGYTGAVRQSMNQILEQMVKDLSGDGFHRALLTAG